MKENTSNPHRRWLIVIGGAAAAAAAAIAITLTAGHVLTTEPSAAAPKDLNGNAVAYDPDATPNPAASATPNGSGRFVANSVGLNVPLGSLDVVDGVITPPGFTSAYLVRNYGVAPDRAGLGAVYVVMHSLRNGGNGPGNALIDVAKKQAKIQTGATITVDDVDYVVTGAEAVSKQQLPDSDIWAAGPNELVVITCLQRGGGAPSVDNLVIEAHRAG